MFEQVKICALILVDELIIDNAYFYSKKYWQEVKQEINNYETNSSRMVC